MSTRLATGVLLLCSAASAGSPGSSADAAVRAPPGSLVRLRTGSAAIEVVAAKDKTVRAEVPDPAGVRVTLRRSGGDRFDVEFDGHSVLKAGLVRLAVPPGTRLDLESGTGAIGVQGTSGDVRLRTASGAVSLGGPLSVDAESLDGDLSIQDARGPARIRTVSGKVHLSLSSPAPEADVDTSSGDVTIAARCGKGCRLDGDSVSGSFTFELDPQSSFELRFVSHQGALQDEGLALARSPKKQQGDDSWSTATKGDGAGAIECETFSGDVRVRPRPGEK
jgi:hypothetical protein